MIYFYVVSFAAGHLAVFIVPQISDRSGIKIIRRLAPAVQHRLRGVEMPMGMSGKKHHVWIRIDDFSELGILLYAVPGLL